MIKDREMMDILEQISGKGSKKAADGIAWLLGEEVEVTTPGFKFRDFNSIIEELGGPEAEVVGIYMEALDEIPIHVMLLLPLSEAYRITEQLVGEPQSTIMEIDDLGSSALAEMANMTGSHFFNTIAEYTHKTLRPSTPAVMIDMLGSILTIIAAKTGCVSDEVFTFETAFARENQDLKINFRAISSPEVMKFLTGDDD